MYASCSASPPPHATLASRRLARSEHKCVEAVTAGQLIVSGAADEPVGAVSPKEKVVTAIPIQGLTAVAGRNNAGTVPAGQLVDKVTFLPLSVASVSIGCPLK